MTSTFEKYMKLAGYDINSAEKKINRLQSFDLEEFRVWHDKSKWEIARYHYENNPFYRKKSGKTFPDRWEDLPIMTKSDFQNDLESLMSRGYSRKNTYISNTSGSSGHPFFFAKNKEAHAMDWALIKNRYAWHGLTLKSKQARFFGITLEMTSHLRERLKDAVMNRVRFPVFDLSDKALSQFLEIFKRKRFEVIYGYTNSLVLFARFLRRKEIVLKELCPTICVCITTSEVLTPEDRKVLTEAFGVKVVNEYGASETGLIAFESPSAEFLLCEEILHYEILDKNNTSISGEGSGHIVVTDLDNRAMPFIRYKIGDIGAVSNSVSSDGFHRKLLNLLGRENDNIILPSGRISPGLTFYYISRSILESSGVLREFIIRQTKLNEFVFDVVTDRELSVAEINDIQSKTDKYLEPGLTIIINKVDRIQRPPSGKIKHFYSELS